MYNFYQLLKSRNPHVRHHLIRFNLVYITYGDRSFKRAKEENVKSEHFLIELKMILLDQSENIECDFFARSSIIGDVQLSISNQSLLRAQKTRWREKRKKATIWKKTEKSLKVIKWQTNINVNKNVEERKMCKMSKKKNL